MRGIANFFCNNVPHLAYKEFLGILKVENKSAGFLNQGKSWYTHYELEGYEIEGSVLKKCHFNRVTSV